MPEPLDPARSVARFVGRRGFLAGSLAVGAGAALAACTGNTPPPAAAPAPAPNGGGAAPSAATPGKAVTIGFSAPAADHGWIAAIAANAQSAAGHAPHAMLPPANPTTHTPHKIPATHPLNNQRVGALVIPPNDATQLTAQGTKVMPAGIRVNTVDWIFNPEVHPPQP